MRTITITFVDHGPGTDARLAASILAQSLRTQGRHPEHSSQSVTFQTTNASPPQVLVLLSEDLLHEPVILNAVDSETAVVLCSARSPHDVAGELGRPAARVSCVDGEGIAAEQGTDQVIALLGGAARMVPDICIECLTASVWSAYDSQFAYGARAAARALDLGYTLTEEWQAAF
ncbi:MAG TPA: hypothetical protein VK191_01775 [Symbiobacteriaceae bacterium]|nr:hypothetical protein [Symbiobacteriaceae bacterium]